MNSTDTAKKATVKLAETLKKYGRKKEGEVVVHQSGQKYRYDTHTLDRPFNWVVKDFEAAAVENGVEWFKTGFRSGRLYFHHDRNPYKGQDHGPITVSELIFL